MAAQGGPHSFYRDSFCPDCLVAGVYLRRIWRAAFCCCCPVHRRSLVDGCPNCGAGFDYYDENFEMPYAMQDSPVICRHCRHGLTPPILPVADDVLSFQQFTLDLVERTFYFRTDRADLSSNILSTVHRLMEAFHWLEELQPGFTRLPPGESANRRKQVADKAPYVFERVAVRQSLFKQVCEMIGKQRDVNPKFTKREQRCLELLRPAKRRMVADLARTLLPIYRQHRTGKGLS